MFYILNNNVEDVSVGGIFSVLDLIFNEYPLPYLAKEKGKESNIEKLSSPKRKKKKNY